jgi:crotonobetaine/carnitine-CoA ligase
MSESLAGDRRWSIPELLDDRAARHPDKPFVRVGDSSLTYRGMCERAGVVAAGLAASGVERGDRVALISASRIEIVELMFACARSGVVQVPLNTFLKGEFLRYQLVDCRADTVVVDGPGLESVRAVAPELPGLRRIVLLDGETDASPVPGVEQIAYRDLPSGPPIEFPTPAPGDLFSLLYTSGTTGMPKGCMLSHAYFLQVGRAWGEDLCGFTRDDVIYTTLPLSHLSGQSQAVMNALNLGASVVLDPTFSASEFFARATEVGATVSLGVGAMAHALAARPPSDADREHSLRFCSFTPLPSAAQEAFEDRFGVVVSQLGYGQTECAPISYDTRMGVRDRDSVGHPAPWLEVRLVDSDDVPVPAGETGEIVLRPRRPDRMFDGYWDKPEATVEAFRNLWHHTGDIGRIDEHGLLHFVDRKKDAMRRRGENVSSIELEMAILRHPHVAEVAVHAVSSAATEDDIKACIVPAGNGTLTAEELFGFFRETLPYFAVPRYVEFVPALPRNAMGRVLKHELRANPLGPATIDFEELGLTITARQRRS